MWERLRRDMPRSSLALTAGLVVLLPIAADCKSRGRLRQLNKMMLKRENLCDIFTYDLMT
jgi:hypothetical protein